MINKSLADFVITTYVPSKYYIHDYYMALSASILGKCAYLDIPTMDYRLHANNAVAGRQKNKTQANVGKIFRDSFRNHKKLSKRAQYTLSCFSAYLSAEDKIFLKDLSSLSSINRFRRIRIYEKYGLVHGILSYMYKFIKW